MLVCTFSALSKKYQYCNPTLLYSIFCFQILTQVNRKDTPITQSVLLSLKFGLCILQERTESYLPSFHFMIIRNI
jgi:hypothetical protein